MKEACFSRSGLSIWYYDSKRAAMLEWLESRAVDSRRKLLQVQSNLYQKWFGPEAVKVDLETHT